MPFLEIIINYEIIVYGQDYVKPHDILNILSKSNKFRKGTSKFCMFGHKMNDV